MRVRCLVIGVLFGLVVPAAPALAANATVTATPGSTFMPKDVTINAGDMVTWNNGGGVHNVHFDDNSFVQPPTPSSAAWSVSRTFPGAGTFRYHCDLHGGPNGAGMSGTVWVNGPGYARPLSASPLRASLAIAYRQCQAASANRTHGAPLAHPSCNPPAQTSDWLTVGTFDANGENPNFVGSVTLRVQVGDPTNQTEESDVHLISSIKDVRNKSGLADYTGELQVRLPLRITDRMNGSAADERATGDTTIAFTLPCTATGSAGIGSTCAATTTADALAPGSVLEGKRALWEVQGVQVFDGGPDGLASTAAGNTLFASQAVFIP